MYYPCSEQRNQHTLRQLAVYLKHKINWIHLQYVNVNDSIHNILQSVIGYYRCVANTFEILARRLWTINYYVMNKSDSKKLSFGQVVAIKCTKLLATSHTKSSFFLEQFGYNWSSSCYLCSHFSYAIILDIHPARVVILQPRTSHQRQRKNPAINTNTVTSIT